MDEYDSRDHSIAACFENARNDHTQLSKDPDDSMHQMPCARVANILELVNFFILWPQIMA